MLTSVAPAMAAQVRIRIPPAAGQVAPPRVVNKAPPANMIKQFQANNPAAKVVGVKPAGNGYIVTFKKGNTVGRTNIPGP